MAIGLGGGLLLAAPLAEVITARASDEVRLPSITNPFAAWSGGMGRQDLLILGTDVGGGNTDVIATLRIEGDRTQITQIPRDTYIEAESFGPVKINALYSLGGTDAVKREISQRLGRPIQHHLVVNLSAIRQMADMLGGIEVDVPKRMLYVDRSQGLSIDLQPGVQTSARQGSGGVPALPPRRDRGPGPDGPPAAGPPVAVPQTHPARISGAAASPDAGGPQGDPAPIWAPWSWVV